MKYEERYPDNVEEVIGNLFSEITEETQENIAMEELAELIVAIFHHRREKVNIESVINEIADVIMMIEQLIFIYEIPNKVIKKHLEDRLNRIEKLLGDQ